MINSPLLTGLCTATVVALAAGDEINGNLERIMTQLQDINKRLRGVEDGQIRTEGKVDSLIERSQEDRARIKINEDNIGNLSIQAAHIEGRQKEWAAVQGVFSTLAATIAAIIGSQR